MLAGRDVEITDKDGVRINECFTLCPLVHFIEKAELVREFLVDVWVGFVAAGRYIKIVYANSTAVKR